MKKIHTEAQRRPSASIDQKQKPKPKCDVCGEPAVGLRCSSTGAVSFLYCAKCLKEDREPYWALVASAVGIESWDSVAEWYRPVILSNLKAEGKTLEEFFADVEEAENTMAQAMEAAQISPTLPPLAVYPEEDQGFPCVLRGGWTVSEEDQEGERWKNSRSGKMELQQQYSPAMPGASCWLLSVQYYAAHLGQGGSK